MNSISIIIPIYNAEKYLERTFLCLKNQMFTDFEVLLIDDGSKDNSSLICKKVASEDNRFRYYYQENQGVSAARNNGVALSKGEYITFIDADDIIPENYLEVLSEALENNCSAISFCDVAIIKDGNETKRFTLQKENLNRKETLDLILTREFINSGPCAKLFRRELIKESKFLPLKAYEDILFVVEAINKGDKFTSTNKTEYRYLQNSGSAMSSFKKVPSEDIITATDKLILFIKENKELSPDCFYITASHLMQYVLGTAEKSDDKSKAFVNKARKLYSKYKRDIISNKSFPWKEKITYLAFVCGFIYINRKFVKVNK